MKRKHSHPAISRRRPYPVPVKREPMLANKVVSPSIVKPKPVELVVPKKPLPVTVVCVNYKTLHLTKKAVATFRKFYPKVNMVLVDNNSQDKSSKMIWRLDKDQYITSVILPKNIGHGPAMNNAIRRHVHTPYVFLLDSDTITRKDGFIELMLKKLKAKPFHYAIGWLRHVNTEGVAAGHPGKKFTPYVHPYAALLKVELYLQLPRFEYHGAPCLANMTKARKLKYKVISFPIHKYVEHLVAGTRRMWKGAWDVRDKPVKKAWNPDDKHLI